jgi:hypothetical protein
LASYNSRQKKRRKNIAIFLTVEIFRALKKRHFLKEFLDKPLFPASIPVTNAFSACELGSDFVEQFFMLNFGTRLLTAFTERIFWWILHLRPGRIFPGREACRSEPRRQAGESGGGRRFLKLAASRPCLTFPAPGTFWKK